MSKKIQLLSCSFSQGEVSAYIEARPDLGKRFNAVRVMENYWIFPEGGAFRRPGMRYLCEVKDSTKLTRLIPFERTVTDAFVLEVGQGYFRFIKDRAQILASGIPYQILTSPYQEADLADLHYEQSLDFIFICSANGAYDIQKLARVQDNSWTLANFNATPPPSFDADEDPNVSATTSSATVSGATFTLGGAYFLAGDVGRQIVSGTGRALITAVADSTHATIDILDAFSATSFAAGAWFLRLAPQVTMDVDKKEPIGTTVALAAGAASLRASYIGKFIKILGGTIKITAVASTTAATGTIMSILSDATTANPAIVPAGAWRLQEASWSATRGRPQTVVLHQGRPVFFSTVTQPTTFWAPSLNDIYNFATGALATDAYEYTMQGGRQNPIQWAVSLGGLYIGDAQREHSAKGQGVDAPIGGDETPFVTAIGSTGSMHAQPIIVDSAILFLQRFGHDVFQLSYSLSDSPDAATFVPADLGLFARQISDMRFVKHRGMYQLKPNSMAFWPLVNGQLAGLTFKPRQEVVAWSRTVTAPTLSHEGLIESQAIVPHENGRDTTMYFVVKRVINGVAKRFIEYIDTEALTSIQRTWQELHTDCAKIITVAADTDIQILTGLSHLEGENVDVIYSQVIVPFDGTVEAKDGTYLGSFPVSGGQVDLGRVISGEGVFQGVFEVGLHYDSTITTLRPAVPNTVTEGYKRYWPSVQVRLKDSIGGTLNGKPLKPAGPTRRFTGLSRLENVRTEDDWDGSLTIRQTQPYPHQILGISGTCEFADEAG